MTTLIAALRELHRPHGIYGDCGHTHEETDAGVVDIDEIGLTCAKEFDVCVECCLVPDEVAQSEWCNDHHQHGPGLPICKTVALLDQHPDKPEPFITSLDPAEVRRFIATAHAIRTSDEFASNHGPEGLAILTMTGLAEWATLVERHRVAGTGTCKCGAYTGSVLPLGHYEDACT